MILDRRKTHQIEQALLRARNMKDGNNILENVTQSSTASGDGSYDKPVFGGMGFSAEPQSSVTTGDEAASQSHMLLPMSRSYPLRGPAKLPHAEVTNMAKARGIPAHDQFSFGAAPSTLSRLSYGQPLGTSKTNPASPRETTFRVADGEPDIAKEVPRQERKMPEVHYKTSGEIWSEFLGGIGKGIAQAVVDGAIEGAKVRRSVYGGVYIDTPHPVLFDPPTSSWDNTGREIAPGIMAVTGTAPLKGLKPRRFKIGKVTPPKHLIPGTGPFGDYMHEEIVKMIRPRYPDTIFHDNVKPGRRGIDMSYESGETQDFPYLEIKSDKQHSIKQLRRQIYNWGYEEPDVKVITYDDYGNVYEGFSD